MSAPSVEMDRAITEHRVRREMWWYEGPAGPEAHVRQAREDMPYRTRDWDRWFSENYTSFQIAYLIEKGLVSAYPLEFTRLGYRWHSEGNLPPPRSNKFWQEVRSPPCAETDS
jgi:hypothetical protein